MSKFVKRVRKSFKNPRNVLVIGTGFGYLEELCENFANVFIISTLTEPYKKRNLVYKETFDNIEFLPNLDIIFMDRNQDLHVEKLKTILLKYHPSIFVEGNLIFGKNEYKFLKSYNYSVVEMFGDYHLWKYDR